MSATEEREAPTGKVLVSSARKPVSYINVCKRRLQEHGEVHLSALGIAISTLVTVAELLKTRGYATETKIITFLENREDSEDATKSRRKPKMEITLTKSDKFDELMEQEAAREAAKKAAEEAEEAKKTSAAEGEEGVAAGAEVGDDEEEEREEETPEE